MQIERLKDFSENIVESLHVGVLAVDLEGRIESWNTQVEQLVGVSRGDAIGRNLETVLPADMVTEIEARAADEHVSSIYKFHLRNRAGRPLVVNVSMAPLVGKAGERLGRLILVDDITQRTRLEEQLMQTEKLTSLGLLAAGVAHEVNTPLAVISNYIQMLAKQFPGDDPRGVLIEKIIKQTFRASEIVNNLLNFSRIGAAQFSEVNMNYVVEETLSAGFASIQDGARGSCAETAGRFAAGAGLEQPPAAGISEFVYECARRHALRRNAGSAHGVLERHVEVEVTDTGLGISRENLNRIFDPFFTTKATGRGTGPGPLRKLRHHQRTCGQDRCSLDARARALPSGWNSQRPGKRLMSKGSILVVDDEAEIREGLELLLSSEGYDDHQRGNRRRRSGASRRTALRSAAAGRQPAGPQRPRSAARNPRPRSRTLRRADHRLRLDRHGARGVQKRRAGLHHQAVVE